jgi:dihydrodipicolinate synthase/N-acetylneuraminate lyase
MTSAAVVRGPKVRSVRRAARKSPAEVRAGLVGPVNSIPVTFTREGELDWDGIANMVELGFAGPRGEQTATMLTVGDSQLMFMSDEEVAQLHRFVAQRVRGRGVLIGATGRWWTPKVNQFAELCRDCGVDVLMALPNEHAAQDAVGVEGFYRGIAAVMPTMIVGVPPQIVLERLSNEPNVCCFKEDGSAEYALHAIMRFGARYTVVTGGCHWRFLAQYPYGVRAYMDWLAPLAPHRSAQFWRLVEAGDVIGMGRFVVEVELPISTFAGNELFGCYRLSDTGSFPGGWQSVWRAALEVNGIAQRYRRAPLPAAGDRDLASLRPLLRKLDLLRRGKEPARRARQ